MAGVKLSAIAFGGDYNSTTDTLVTVRNGATDVLTSFSNVLAGYVPYTGATTNVDLGTHTLTATKLKTIGTSNSIVADYGGNGTNIVLRTADSATVSAIFSSSSLDSGWHCLTLQNRSDSSVSIFQMINSSGGVMAAFSQLGSLGIGPNAISSPAHAGRLVIEDSVGGGAGSVGAQITNTNGAGEAFLSVNSDAGQLSIENFGSTFVTTALRNSGSITANSGLTGGFNFLVIANAPLGFYTNNTQRGQFTAGGSFTVGNGTTGNLIIDSTGAITKISGTTNANLNSGQLALNNPGGQVFLTSTGTNTSVGLAIAGSAKFLLDPGVYNTKTLTIANDYILAFSSTTSVQGAVDTGFSRTAIATVALGNGTAGNATGTLLAGIVFINSGSGDQFVVQRSGADRFRVHGDGSQTHITADGIVALNFDSYTSYNFGNVANTATSGTAGFFSETCTFSPTSGTAIWNMHTFTPTINQTGGANGITRGLYINPTLTAAADFRAIEVTTGNSLLRNVKLTTAGDGIYIKEGSNATMGTGTLVGGTATISTTKVTANSRIHVTDTGGGVLANIGALYAPTASIVVGTSFVVSSSNALDTSTFNWIIFEPA